MFDRISANPNICGGRPCIEDTRIPVTMVLELLEDGLTFEKILKDYYPHITVADIQACIEYAKRQAFQVSQFEEGVYPTNQCKHTA